MTKISNKSSGWWSRVKTVRSREDLTQVEWAKQLKFSEQQIARFETGRTEPPINFLDKLVKTYGISLHWLLLGQGEMYWLKKTGESDLARLNTGDLKKEVSKRERLLSIVRKNVQIAMQEAERASSGYNIESMRTAIVNAGRTALPPDAPDWLKRDMEDIFDI